MGLVMQLSPVPTQGYPGGTRGNSHAPMGRRIGGGGAGEAKSIK